MNTVKKTVTVLIPAYNAEDYIEETLDSVAAQTRLPESILVIDDGSGDNTAKRVERWAAAHEHVSLTLLSQPNQGVSMARNNGIKAADTDLVALLDSDDLMCPGHLALLLDAFDRVNDLVIAFGDQSVFSEMGVIQESFFLEGKRKRVRDVPVKRLSDDLLMLQEPAWMSLIWGDYIPTSGSVLSRKAMITAGLYDDGLKTSEDRDLLLRVSRLGKVAYSRKIVANKREHQNNLTHSRHDFRTVYNAYRVVAKQINNAEALGLNQAELAETRRALDSSAESLAYAASLNGLPALMSVRKELTEMGYGALLRNPKIWIKGCLALFRAPE